VEGNLHGDVLASSALVKGIQAVLAAVLFNCKVAVASWDILRGRLSCLASCRESVGCDRLASLDVLMLLEL
jgi:hypothetical protein